MSSHATQPFSSMLRKPRFADRPGGMVKRVWSLVVPGLGFRAAAAWFNAPNQFGMQHDKMTCHIVLLKSIANHCKM